MKNHKVVIEQCFEFTPENINDLIVCALEGGINYWCGKAEIKMDGEYYLGVAPHDESKVELASDVIGFGGTLILTDAEDDDEQWELNIEKMLKGIKMYCESNNVQLSELMDIHDADSVDCIVQYALFNEITFG